MSKRLHAGRQGNPPFPHPPTQILCLLLSLLITPSSGKLATLTYRELTSAPLLRLQAPDPSPNASGQRLFPQVLPGRRRRSQPVPSAHTLRGVFALPNKEPSLLSFFLTAFANLTFFISHFRGKEQVWAGSGALLRRAGCRVSPQSGQDGGGGDTAAAFRRSPGAKDMPAG